ncbi:unnamed protein product, partial [Citrullus colocynthis]
TGAWNCVRGSVNSDSRASSLIESAKAERRKIQKIAFTVRGLKVPPNSASLEEARNRVFDLWLLFLSSVLRSPPRSARIPTSPTLRNWRPGDFSIAVQPGDLLNLDKFSLLKSGHIR